jgi:hypothetical protein
MLPADGGQAIDQRQDRDDAFEKPVTWVRMGTK